jgi:hypothetical protein
MSEQLGMFGVGDLPDEKRDVLRRINRGQAVDAKVLSRLKAHGLVYFRTSDSRHRLTPPGRVKAGL